MGADEQLGGYARHRSRFKYVDMCMQVKTGKHHNIYRSKNTPYIFSFNIFAYVASFSHLTTFKTDFH